MIRSFSRRKFETKLNLGICLIVLGSAIVLMPFVARMSSHALMEEGKKRGISMAESLASRAVDPLLARDYLRLSNIVSETGDALYTFIQDVSGNVVSHSFDKGFPIDLMDANKPTTVNHIHVQFLETGTETILDFAAPVMVAGESIGTVRIGLSKSRINAAIQKFIVALALLFGLTLLASVILGSVFSRTITRRLARLRLHAEDLVKGDHILNPLALFSNACWELLSCREMDCPAYGNRERRCWHMPRTHCHLHVSPSGVPRDVCRNCKVFQTFAGDEIQDLTETFDFMAYTLRDRIQTLHETEQNLIKQQNLLSTVLDMNPDRVSMVDTQMVYQTVNLAFARSVGKGVEEIYGLNDFQLFPAKEAERRYLEGRLVLTNGSRVDRQEKVETPEGIKWFQVVQIPVLDEQGTITGLLWMDRDITNIKEYEQQLLQAQKMESIGKLAGGVAHEINTPLGIILGYSQLLQEGTEECQLIEDLKIIESQTKICRKIVADLLGFSRQNVSEKREMCINTSVMECVSLVKHAFSLDKVEILSRLDNNFPTMYGDPEKLKQVWMNLLTNAKDAMPAGGGIIVVTTELNSPRGIVSMQIADNGCGITPASKSKIFDPFFTTKAVGKGTGLGLAVSYGIIKDHQGEIRIESPLPAHCRITEVPADSSSGPGTLITVNIPLDHCSSATN